MCVCPPELPAHGQAWTGVLLHADFLPFFLLFPTQQYLESIRPSHLSASSFTVSRYFSPNNRGKWGGKKDHSVPLSKSTKQSVSWFTGVGEAAVVMPVLFLCETWMVLAFLKHFIQGSPYFPGSLLRERQCDSSIYVNTAEFILHYLDTQRENSWHSMLRTPLVPGRKK